MCSVKKFEDFAVSGIKLSETSKNYVYILINKFVGVICSVRLALPDFV